MFSDCHIHMVLDGENWKSAIGRHRQQPDEVFVRRILQAYQQAGFTYLRDGGDRWGAGKLARTLAPEYGITYRTPLSPICCKGHYGSFIGNAVSDLQEYRQAVRRIRLEGGDFIKIMISGLMDFDRCGILTEPGLEADWIREMIAVAHGEGMAVMAHANGADTVRIAAEAGVDSVEHGAYLDAAAMGAMRDAGTVWVPTLSTIGNLRSTGRYAEDAVAAIFALAQDNIRTYCSMGGLLAPGSDAGAWAVPHAGSSEYRFLQETLGSDTEKILNRGIRVIQQKFVC